MAHIGRGVAVDAGAPMTAAYGADGHSHQRASSAEASESLGGRSSAIVRERLFHAITVTGKGLRGGGRAVPASWRQKTFSGRWRSGDFNSEGLKRLWSGAAGNQSLSRHAPLAVSIEYAVE